MRNHNKLLSSLLLALVAIVGMRGAALAANPKSVTLKPGKTYTSYDITGDKKADTIVISPQKFYYEGTETGVYESMTISVNGATVYTLNKPFFYPETTLYTLANGKPFLRINATSDDFEVTVSGLFQYKSGKLKQVVDFHNIASKCGRGQVGVVESVSGNTLKVKYTLATYAFGYSEAQYTYKYSNGTLKKATSTGTLKKINLKKAPRSLTTRTRLTAYKTHSSGTKAFTIPAGKTVRIDKCYFTKTNLRFRVRYHGTYGWVKAATSAIDQGMTGFVSRQFKNVQLDF